MTANSVYLAIAPNILRKTVQDLARLDLPLDLIPPQTHQEMLEFAENFGQSEVPGISLCAYPQYLYNLLKYQNTGNLAAMPDTLPPMRQELTSIGMAEPSRYFRVIGVVPFLIASANDVEPPIEDWADLCRPDLARAVAVPPHDTPLPALFDAVMSTLYGDKAQDVITNKNTTYTPLDINKRVDAGEFKAGVSIPAFSRNYRNGNGHLVWPKSGAWPVPLIAAIRQDADKGAFEFLHYLLSSEYQRYLAESGLMIPVLAGIPWFKEMEANNGKLNWPGWNTFVALGKPAEKYHKEQT